MDIQINEMYQKRLNKMEIKKMPTERTIDKHATNLLKLNIHITNKRVTDIKSLSWLYLDPEDLLKEIRSLPGRKTEFIGPSAIQAYVFSVLVGIRVIEFDHYEKNSTYTALWKMLQSKSKDSLGTEIKEYKSDKSDVYVPDFEIIDPIIDEFVSIESADVDMKIILEIYRTFPFRLEVSELKFIKNLHTWKMITDKSENYLVKHSKGFFFSFNNYKTYDRYGERKIDINSKELVKLLKIKTKNMESNEFFFGGGAEGGMLRNTMSKKITTFFEVRDIRGITPTNLTKMIIQREYSKLDPAMRTIQDRLAKERGHSVQTQMEVYLIERKKV
tara:strand:+ start:1698 stop:2687 length:990 start_codon:yes stop_codon:yes gene_type:complete